MLDGDIKQRTLWRASDSRRLEDIAVKTYFRENAHGEDRDTRQHTRLLVAEVITDTTYIVFT